MLRRAPGVRGTSPSSDPCNAGTGVVRSAPAAAVVRQVRRRVGVQPARLHALPGSAQVRPPTGSADQLDGPDGLLLCRCTRPDSGATGLAGSVRAGVMCWPSSVPPSGPVRGRRVVPCRAHSAVRFHGPSAGGRAGRPRRCPYKVVQPDVQRRRSLSGNVMITPGGSGA